MSIWTHVNAIFRLDSIQRISNEQIVKIFGKSISYDELTTDLYNKKNKLKTLPMGSEGSLRMSVWKNPDKNSIASATISIFGDLRDFDNNDELKKWFNTVCKDIKKSKIFWLRQAVMQICNEKSGSKIYKRDC